MFWKDNRRVRVSQDMTQPSKSESESLVRGTATIVFNVLALRITEQGSDTIKIGRCSYLTIVDKYELKTTLNNCY